MIVRRANPADLPRIVEIAKQSAGAAQWSSGDYARILSEGSAASTRVVLVIGEENGGQTAHEFTIYGFLVAQEVGAEWEIENLAIEELARRHGLGLHLLGKFLQVARDRHGREVFLEVRESNAAARGLYAKCTFVEAGRRRSYYRNPEEDALILKFSFLQK